MKKLLALIICALPAYGSILFEPYAGLAALGTFEQDSVEGDFTGFSYGAKIGFQHLYLYGGLDYRLGNYQMTSDSGSHYLDDESFSHEQYFAFLGVDLPSPLKFWAGMAVGGDSSADTTDFGDGAGTLIGVGFKTLQVVSLNLEYMSWSYDEIDPGGGSLEASQIVFSLSTPIRF